MIETATAYDEKFTKRLLETYNKFANKSVQKLEAYIRAGDKNISINKMGYITLPGAIENVTQKDIDRNFEATESLRQALDEKGYDLIAVTAKHQDYIAFEIAQQEMA